MIRSKGVNTLELRRSMPMLFHTEIDDESYYWVNGTFFTVGFRNKYFIVTNFHVLADKKPRECLFGDLEYHGHAIRIVPIIMTPFKSNELKDAHKDLVVFEIDLARCEADHQKLIIERSYEILETGPKVGIRTNDMLEIVGYPLDPEPHISGQDMDHEKKLASFNVFPIPAKFIDFDPETYLFRVRLARKLNLGGVSGSPIYKKEGLQNKYPLVGIMVRGGSRTHPSEFAHFIPLYILKLCLIEALRS